MIVLRAAVRRVTGLTRHAKLSRDGVVPLAAATLVRIEPTGDGAYLLIRFDETGAGITDTWHESVEEAKRQARFEYEIEEADWQEEPN